MRARQVLKILYELFWVLLGLFPILFYLCALTNVYDIETFEYLFDNLFMLNSGYVIQIMEWLGSNTGLGFDSVATVWHIIDYFVTVEIVHFIVDVFLWVFRFARKILDSWGVKE